MSDNLRSVAKLRFRSIDEPFLDTTTAQGELLMTLLAGLAQFERKLTLERAA
ncbi:MAG: recombinase family protein [Alphaproteobacteria bacterium]|nr:recombinase family protein [Alphaproteobacteria bacterium]